MRPPLEPRPTLDALLRRPLHQVVADHAEALAVLRARGVDVSAAGALPLESLPGGRAHAEAVRERTAWRPAPASPPPPGDREDAAP